MKKYLLTLTVLLLSLTAVCQDVKIDIYKTRGAAASSWQLTGADMKLLFSDGDFSDADSVSLTLARNSGYYLYLSVTDIFIADTTFYTVYMDGEEEFSVKTNLGYGDYWVPFNTGMRADDSKIIGGTNASISDYPWQILLQYTTGGYIYSCGGTIIADNWILTAAHCTTDKDEKKVSASTMVVYTGSSYGDNGDEYLVDSIIRHEHYSSVTYSNDIALLRLAEPINTSNATPIKLVTAGDALEGVTAPGVMATVTGWGLTGVDPDVDATVLQQVELPIVSRQTASTVWDAIPQNVIMAGYHNGTKDACSGDSGGPLVVNVGDEGFKIAGIVSWGNADCNTYGAYTEVSAFEDWIRSKTGIVDITPDVPEGDELVCQATPSSTYTTEALVGADGYEWEVYPAEAAVVTSNGTSAVFAWDKDFWGEALVKVRALDGGNASVWSRLPVTVGQTTSITQLSEDVDICANLSFSLDVNAKGHNLNFEWYKDDNLIYSGTIATIQRANATESQSGNYHCLVSGTCGSVASSNINVEIMPLTKINYTTPDTTVSFGSNSSIRLGVVGHDLNYVWKKDGVTVEGVNSAVFPFDGADANDIGNYSCTATGSCGTKTSLPHYFYVNKEESAQALEFFIWPTVTSGSINVALSDNTEYNVKIFNSIGKLMYEDTGMRYQQEIDLSRLPRGIYIVQVYNDKLRKAQKIIVN